MQAKTAAGWGPLSDSLTVVTQTHPPPAIVDDLSTRPDDLGMDQHLGVVIGLVIGVAIALMCTLVLLWRSRCIKSLTTERGETPVAAAIFGAARSGGQHAAAPLGVHQSIANGNGLFKSHHAALKKKMGRSVGSVGGVGGGCHTSLESGIRGGSMVEMDVFVPMLSTIPVDEAPHLDTKVMQTNFSYFVSTPPSSS